MANEYGPSRMRVLVIDDDHVHRRLCQHIERLRAAVAAQADETKLEIEAADGAYRAGRGSQADVFAARAARADASVAQRSDVRRAYPSGHGPWPLATLIWHAPASISNSLPHAVA